MNQEKIMKAKMVTAIFIALAAVVAVFVFAGLYFDQRRINRLEYIDQYENNILLAAEEIDMVLSDLGAARSIIFLIDDYTEKRKIINELHYCFVKYPNQMREKLDDSSKALHDIADHLDKGYDEAKEIVDSINKLGD